MAAERSMEKLKKQHFRETMERLTAASHVQTEYFEKHNRIEGYYERLSDGKFFHCDRLLKQENMFGSIQLGYNPNRERVFLYANLKTSRYDTIASTYQKQMADYQQESLLKGDNENRAYVSQRWENAAVLIEKKENKPWTHRSVKAYLKHTNMGAARKSMPFFTREEEFTELERLRKEQKKNRDDISALRRESAQNIQGTEDKIRTLQQKAVEQLSEENLLEAILIRKSAAEKTFLRKINYAFDFQKKDIESYYREKRKTLEDRADSFDTDEGQPEEEDNS